MDDNAIALQESKNAFSLAPRNLDEAMQYAKLLAESTVVPLAYQKKPADILVAVQLGMELGFSAVQSLQSIAVINGRPSVWGQGVVSLILASPVCESLKIPGTDEVREARKATVIAKRKGYPEVIGTFTEADAKLAKLETKDTYAKWWPDMYLWRAFHRATKMIFADVLKGVIPREIDEDFRAIATSSAGHEIMRRPTREPRQVTEQAMDDFLKPDAPVAAAMKRGAAVHEAVASPAPESRPDLERVGIIKAVEGLTKAKAPMVEFTITRANGSTLDGFCFHESAVAALKRAHADGLAALVKIERTKGKDGKMYDNVVEAIVVEPADPSPDPEA